MELTVSVEVKPKVTCAMTTGRNESRMLAPVAIGAGAKRSQQQPHAEGALFQEDKAWLWTLRCTSPNPSMA